MEIEFKIIAMEKSETKRFNVKIAYRELGSDKPFKSHPFSFTNDQLIKDAFMEKIKQYLQIEFGDNPEINKEKYLNKTNYYRVR